MDMRMLLDKLDKEIVLVRHSMPLKEVIELLLSHNVSATVVCDASESLNGLLTEHDIVVAVNEYGDQVTSVPAEDVMEVDFVYCTPDTTLKEALSLMSENNIRHLPVLTEGGHLLGVASVVDVMREFLLSLDVVLSDKGSVTLKEVESAPHASKVDSVN